MPIFMTHAEHGATHVNSGEVEAHEKLGWKQDTYRNWMAPKRVNLTKPDDCKEIQNGDEIRAQWAEKFGKEPHHRKSTETLRRELE